MLGSVSAGRKQLSSKHVVQPGERRLQGNLNRTTYLSKAPQSLCTNIAPLRPSNLIHLVR